MATQPTGNSTPRSERGVPFSTRNIPLACFLAAHGFVPAIRAVDARTVRFEFEPSDALTEKVTEFSDGHPVVNPVAYDTWNKSLRTQIQAALEAYRGRSA